MKSKLEQEIDKELEVIGVRSYVYHVRAYDEGSYQRQLLRMFNGITIVDVKLRPSTDFEADVYRMIEELKEKLKRFARADLHPATWMMKELNEMGYYGVAICDSRDNFSRERGRVIAKGRLLKHLRLPELLDGTKW